MNIDQYRLLVASQKESEKDQPEDVAIDEKEETKIVEGEVEKVEDVKEDVQSEETTPEVVIEEDKHGEIDKITIDGVELTVDEIKEYKKGYMRNKDYTQKTQALSEQRREVQDAIDVYNYLRENPDAARLLAEGGSMSSTTSESIDPTESRIRKLERELADSKIQNEIVKLEARFPDFDARTVLEFASKERIADLESAYYAVMGREVLSKKGTPKDVTEKVVDSAPIDTEAIKNEMYEELKKQILEEIKAEEDTGTLISTTNAPLTGTIKEKKLTPAQKEVANKFRSIDAETYLKYR